MVEGDRDVDAGHGAGIDEAEHVRGLGPRALDRHVAGQLILEVKRLHEPELQRVLTRRRQDWRLVVRAARPERSRRAIHVRGRVQAKKGRCLRADP
jgi:hypothetical protein